MARWNNVYILDFTNIKYYFTNITYYFSTKTLNNG